jgi:acetyltransferase-like isoleucine patch superfamily enzyme
MTFYLLFPLFFFVGIIIFILSAILVSKFFLIIVNIIHKPREGIFNRDKSDKDYCYWSLRAIIKKWPAWLARQLNLPLLETILFKILGVKTSFSNSLNEGWVDCEFIEFGKNVKIGQGSIIMSNIIIKDKLIIKKVILHDNVIVGAHSVILPGTIIESNSIIDSTSMTAINQHIEGNASYSGTPVNQICTNSEVSNKSLIEQQIFERGSKDKYDEEILKTHEKELGLPFHLYIASGWLIIGGSFMLPGFLFILFVYEFLIPDLFLLPLSLNLLIDFWIIVRLLITPLIFIFLYLLHLFFVVLFTRWFYRFADKRGPTQGVFDRNLDATSTALDYYHFRSFLFKYPIFAVIRSPFPWLLNWELRFIGSNKIGKGTIFEECYIHSHINYGKNCYVGTFSHITNHLVDGVYGSENLTLFGAESGDSCIFNALIGGLPGLEVGDNSTLLPMCSTIKFDKLGENGIYAGFPAKKLDKKKIDQILGGEYPGE